MKVRETFGWAMVFYARSAHPVMGSWTVKQTRAGVMRDIRESWAPREGESRGSYRKRMWRRGIAITRVRISQFKTGGKK